uniref:Uncharacterized protein n=1 Tax=Hyaloperonospora arabidopsidis (strain Emoy2) TaxID=559515 RepID=M4BS91_HYAAE
MMERRDTCSYHRPRSYTQTTCAAVTASTVATADAPGTADAAVVGAIVERHLCSISLASFAKSI